MPHGRDREQGVGKRTKHKRGEKNNSKEKENVKKTLNHAPRKQKRSL
jgi:hypothetical protein